MSGSSLKLACAAIAALALGTSAHAATVLVDFGTTVTSSSSPAWNNQGEVAGGTNVLVNLVDTTGAATGISSATSGWTNQGTSGMGGGFTGTANTAFGGAWNDVLIDFLASSNASASITLTGLDTNSRYTFTLTGSRNGSGDRTTVYTAVGGNTLSGTLETAFNTSNVVVLSDVLPTAGGQIALNVTRGADNSVGFTYINAMKIESSPIPEPAALGLLGLAALALV